MTWMTELKKVRRYLRDPNGNIWTDAFLRHLWNDVQNDVQNKTKVLEDVAAQRIPDLYHCAYMHEWEWRHLPSEYTEFYQCLRRHDDSVFCHSWEPQEVTGIASDTDDYGAHFTQPWEAFMGLTPGEEVRMKFPKNFKAVKFIAYDEEPIERVRRKDVQNWDTSYITHTGEPQCYYMHESMDKSYVLYPRPATAFADDVAGDGMALFVSDDSENSDVGTIAIRTGSSESGNIGASVDIVGVQDNILLVYDVSPTDVVSITDEIDFPDYMTKYVRYGVISRAYSANTDGRIPSLAALWNARYEIGIRFIKKFQRMRRTDRDYRLTDRAGARTGRKRLPRLPDTYPVT